MEPYKDSDWLEEMQLRVDICYSCYKISIIYYKYKIYPLEKYPPNRIKPTPTIVNKNFIKNDSEVNQGPMKRITPKKTIIALPDIRLVLLVIVY